MKETKKKINKKVLLFLIPVLALVMVVAGGYYVTHTASFNVNNIDGMGEYSDSLDTVNAGDSTEGEKITLFNDVSEDRVLTITNDVSDEDEIEVNYLSNLVLTQKVVNFSSDFWEVPEGAEEINVKYTLVGDEFSAKVKGNNKKTGYVLIYYPDNDNRFDEPAKVVRVDDVFGNLPYTTDANSDSNDYCETGEYETCHGAKIWYVPEDAIKEDNSLDWSRADEFYFETELIQFNSDGEVVLYVGDELEIIPQYTPSDHAVGDYLIETTIA